MLSPEPRGEDILPGDEGGGGELCLLLDWRKLEARVPLICVGGEPTRPGLERLETYLGLGAMLGLGATMGLPAGRVARLVVVVGGWAE